MFSVKQIALIASRDLRKNQTAAELAFWGAVKDKNFFGFKFLRQHPLFYEYDDKKKFFIADFYCAELGLIVEIDGGIHEQQKDYDNIRTEILDTQHDHKVVRFNNEEVLQNINKVMIQLKKTITRMNKKNK